MALREAVLDEFGLAPLWVRRRAGGEAAGAAEPGDISCEADAAEHAAPAQRAERAPADEPVRHADAPRAGRAPERAGEALRARAGIDEDAAARAAPVPRTAPAPQVPAAAVPSPARASDDEPPPLTEADFPWFDAEPVPAFEPVVPPESEARALPPVQTLDWDALAERVAACERCRLCEKRRNTVFGVGDRNADWMLIGEAPGENEDKQGEPFVGQAGKLLDNMLSSLALARGTNVYIANVIKCRPPGNRNPEPDEVARCEPYLERQVALVKPKLIVALGRFAAQSLLKTDASISSLRGRVHQYQGVPVIVTYHPAYLLRSLHDKSKAWADLCLARETYRRAGAAQAHE
jgi:uracil-DNA glycosylase family 4